MKKQVILILKGMLIGLGKVIPGVSGSLIAVSLGVYEQAMEAIGHFFRHIKDHILFLGTLSIGILISIIFGSQIVVYLLEFCYIPTMLLFIGFIAGAVPSLSRKIYSKNKTFLLCFLVSFLCLILLQFVSSGSNFVPEKNMGSYLVIIGIGFLDAATMIIPGISGTAIFMILGCYAFILNLFADISHFELIFLNFPYYFFFGIGLILGVLLVSRMMSYLLLKHDQMTYSLIMGFTISSIVLLFQKVFVYGVTLGECTLGILLGFIGYYLSLKFGSD